MAEVAQDILDFAVAALGSRAPARQFLGAGIVPYDCEQISVAWASRGLYPSSEGFPAPSTQAAKRPQVTAADFLIEVVRCVPNINTEAQAFPDPADMTIAAIATMTDGETLYCALASSAQSRDAPLSGGCRLMSLGGAIPYGPSGGMSGVKVPLTIQVGCEPAQGS